jgi:pyruvate dehydrogenase (quinone)
LRAPAFRWQRALAADPPVVYEAIVDPVVPPLPPHIEFEQTKNLAQALPKRDPARRGILRQSLEAKARKCFHR